MRVINLINNTINKLLKSTEFSTSKNSENSFFDNPNPPEKDTCKNPSSVIEKLKNNREAWDLSEKLLEMISDDD